jgi:hypothetical protein
MFALKRIGSLRGTEDTQSRISVIIRNVIFPSRSQSVEEYIFVKCYLTTSVELSLSWKATISWGTQEFPGILWNPKVHYRIHKIPLLVPTLSHMNIVHTTLSYIFKNHFNIILPRMSRYCHCSSRLAFQLKSCKHSSSAPSVPQVMSLNFAVVGLTRIE